MSASPIDSPEVRSIFASSESIQQLSLVMPSPDFAAAQDSLLARHQFHAVEAQGPQASQNNSQVSHKFTRLFIPSVLSRQVIDLWGILKGREGTRPAFRVGQLDAELLDEELLQLLKGEVGEGLKFWGPHLREEWASEILLGLRAVLFKFTIWDHSASYGAYLQNLKYTDARDQGPVPQPPSKLQKALYGLLTVGGRYAWTRWGTWLADQEDNYDEPSFNIRLLSRLFALLSTTHSIAAFASFLVFLVNGRYRTVLDRILRLRLVPPTNHASREISFEYLNRQLVWHAFTEFLLFFLPLVGISRWRRWLSRAWRKARTLIRTNGADEKDESATNGEYAFLPERTCAICYQNQNPTSTIENDATVVMGASGGVVGSAQTDVTNPYETIPCGCIYCFVCIGTRLEFEEGDGWICLRCGELVKECKPWAGDVLLETPIPASRKSVSFPEGDKPRTEKMGDRAYIDQDSDDDNISDEGYDSREWAGQRFNAF